jgi:hypothetical protein
MPILDAATALLAVLGAGALLGAEVWVVAVVALGWAVTRTALGASVVARALLVLAASAALYVATVMLLAALVPT